MSISATDFSECLMEWHRQNPRPLPWKGERNPYFVWLSEIILQQTRVEQGLPYYERFKAHYPTVEALADAPEDRVLKDWEGLGYYSRARNLHAAAKHIARELGGVFPTTYEGVRALKGVGPYTAAAIASFAYDLPYAVVDGNVYRVLARVFGIDTPIDSTEGKKKFARLAQDLLAANPVGPAGHNQAMMDFGATQCTPKQPGCGSCPFTSSCIANQKNKVHTLPVKAKKIKKRKRFFQYLVVAQGGRVLLEKRTEKDIWQGLYQFPMVELAVPPEGESAIRNSALWNCLFDNSDVNIGHVAGPFQQTLTHQQISAIFWEVQLPDSIAVNTHDFISVERENLAKFAFPKIIDRYLRDNSLYLKLY